MNTIYNPFQFTLTAGGLNQLGLSMQREPPCSALNHLVVAYLQVHCDRPTPYPIMPDGTQAIYMSPHGSIIGGAHTTPREVQLLTPGKYFGIWFQPGALKHFFNVDLSEISEQMADSRFFGCQRFNQLHNEIYDHSDFSSRVEICESWLLKRFSALQKTPFDYALSLIYLSSGNTKVEAIADKIGWSSRHLNRQFLQHIGLNTKTFSKIIRIQSACQQLHHQATQPEKMQQDLGFYDQSHLIKEFKKHLNVTPSEFISQVRSDFYNQ